MFIRYQGKVAIIMSKIKINKNTNFNIKETFEKMNEYMKTNFVKCPPHKKDFYDWFDRTITCGKCGKKMGLFWSLFHWHLKK